MASGIFWCPVPLLSGWRMAYKEDPPSAQTTAATGKIPIALTGGQLKAEWLATGTPTSGYLPVAAGAGVAPAWTDVVPVSSGGTGGTSGATSPGTWSGAQSLAANAEYVLTHPSSTNGQITAYASQKDSLVQLMINPGGTLIDESIYARTLTLNGETARSTAQMPSGFSASVVFDGTDDDIRVTLTDAFANFDWDSASWVFETFVYFSSNTGFQQIAIAQNSGYSANFSAWGIGNNAGTLNFYASSAGGSWDVANGTSCGAVSATTWYHVAVVYDQVGNTFKIYRDGVLQATISSATVLADNCKYLQIGRNQTVSDFGGYMAGIRLSVYQYSQSTRYPSAFTPPSATLTDDGVVWAAVPVNDLSWATTGMGVRQESATTTRFVNLTGRAKSFNLGVANP